LSVFGGGAIVWLNWEESLQAHKGKKKGKTEHYVATHLGKKAVKEKRPALRGKKKREGRIFAKPVPPTQGRRNLSTTKEEREIYRLWEKKRRRNSLLPSNELEERRKKISQV